MLRVDLPGREPLELEHLVLDVNGTLSDRGELIAAAEPVLAQLWEDLQLHVLSADTFGTARRIAKQIGARFQAVADGAEKLEFVRGLGPGRCIAIGNGANDAQMLQAAAIGIAVVGSEGAHSSAIAACDIATPSITAALGLLAEPLTLTATLRP